MNQDVEYLTEDLQKTISCYVRKEASPEADRINAGGVHREDNQKLKSFVYFMILWLSDFKGRSFISAFPQMHQTK